MSKWKYIADPSDVGVKLCRCLDRMTPFEDLGVAELHLRDSIKKEKR